jgi:GT2 family glycosyltransferase
MRVGILILNINGWTDTIECLESVFRSEHSGYDVVVCDNGSTDGSIERIMDWAAGRLSSYVPPDNPLRKLSQPPIAKPIACRVYERREAEAGGRPGEPTPRLTLIRNRENLGFAGGNNVGLRYLLARDEVDHVWLLNPDTVVEPNALGRMLEVGRNDPEVGICGSTLLYYDAPDRVQALGGASYNRWFALPRHIGAGSHSGARIDAAAVERRMSYVCGASMLVTRAFLLHAGLMNEERFLYFEELDWALRARGRFRMAYAPESIVYHREGAKAGSGAAKSPMADYFFLRNRIRITREFSPAALPTVYMALMVAAVRRIYRGQWDRAGMVARLLWTA